jgi:hypothetical protein
MNLEDVVVVALWAKPLCNKNDPPVRSRSRNPLNLEDKSQNIFYLDYWSSDIGQSKKMRTIYEPPFV